MKERKKEKLSFIFFLLLIQFCIAQNGNLFRGIDLVESNPKFEKIVALDDTNIYWLGEQHGTQDNYTLALKYLTFLINEVGIDYLIIENSYLTEILLNKYLETGDPTLLNQSINNYSGTFYTNQELKVYLESLYELWQELPENRKFQFVSIDIEQTYTASKNYINTFLKQQKLEQKVEQKINFDREKDNQSRRKDYAMLQSLLVEEQKTNDTIAYMIQNMQNVLTAYIEGERWDEVRDSLIFENFRERDQALDFKNKTSFACWGTNHCYKLPDKNKVKWIASLINEKKPEIKQNSTAIVYSKSEFIRHRSKFPKLSRFLFKKIDKNFIRHRFQNEPFNRLKDKKHLKKNSTSRMTMWKVDKLPPNWNFVTQKNKQYQTSDYIDNVILVKDSKHCMPIAN